MNPKDVSRSDTNAFSLAEQVLITPTQHIKKDRIESGLFLYGAPGRLRKAKVAGGKF